MDLRSYLIQIRKERGFSQRDLAEKSGVSPAEISRVESGFRQKPSPAVLRAIARHTVGGAAMTALDKIVYFADMVEPTRAYPGVEELRRLMREADLDEMTLAGLTRSIAFVLEKGHLIHPDTVLARNELLLAGKASRGASGEAR